VARMTASARTITAAAEEGARKAAVGFL